MRVVVLATALALAACSGGSNHQGADLFTPPDMTFVDKTAGCVDDTAFGNQLTNAFGRFDGKIVAVVPPDYKKCPTSNNDHLLLEVSDATGVYRMVVNVYSDRPSADQRVRILAHEAPLTGPAFSPGWHTDAPLDYTNDLGVHLIDFTPYDMDGMVQAITDQMQIGANVSVYCTSSGGDSSHLIHKNDQGVDGAIVINPDTNPTYLLLAFSLPVF